MKGKRRKWPRRAVLPSMGIIGSTLIALRASAGTFEIPIFGQQPRLSAILITSGFALSGASAIGLIASRELVADVKEKYAATQAATEKEHQDALAASEADKQQALDDGAELRADNQALVEQIDFLEATIAEYADDILMGFLQAAGLGTTARISLFAVEYRSARLVARRSLNRSLETAERRPYPLNRGAIGQAWEHEVAFEDKLPPTTNVDRWNKAQAPQHRLDLDVARLLRLKPRSYLIVRLDSADGAETLGLVALESEKPKEISLDQHGELLSGGWSRIMTAALEKMATVSSGREADPQLARKEGF